MAKNEKLMLQDGEEKVITVINDGFKTQGDNWILINVIDAGIPKVMFITKDGTEAEKLAFATANPVVLVSAKGKGKYQKISFLPVGEAVKVTHTEANKPAVEAVKKVSDAATDGLRLGNAKACAATITAALITAGKIGDITSTEQTFESLVRKIYSIESL